MNAIEKSMPSYHIDGNAIECFTFDSLYPDIIIFCVSKSCEHEKLISNRKWFQYYKETNAQDLNIEVNHLVDKQITILYFFELIHTIQNRRLFAHIFMKYFAIEISSASFRAPN